MNDEKQIAQVILDSNKMFNDNYIKKTHSYKYDLEFCLIVTAKKAGLSANLWALLTLAMHWWNDIELWSEDVLAGKDISTENSLCCDSPAKDECEQCQEIGLANPLNH